MQIVIEIDEARYKDIQRIAEVQLESNHFQTAEQIIAKGIPIEQEQKWIPVSERLPKENEYVGDVCKYYLVQDEYGDMQVACYKNTGWYPIHSIKAIGDEIVAWMPLPESYESQESEDEE